LLVPNILSTTTLEATFLLKTCIAKVDVKHQSINQLINHEKRKVSVIL